MLNLLPIPRTKTAVPPFKGTGTCCIWIAALFAEGLMDPMQEVLVAFYAVRGCNSLAGPSVHDHAGFTGNSNSVRHCAANPIFVS